ncbi:MAG TPA: DeoR/GlpR family DNA-binding transcription regulator [Feifaniaceae bacterium]|nr:DeoR/GlpR family DNA-binding transcription regulator [Feifaniaceae bacterium]
MSKQPDVVFAEVRKQTITDIVNKMGKATVSYLCEHFSVSPATIRNDLRELEEAGAIKRTHGGAISSSRINYEPVTSQKEVVRVAQKQAIAKLAATFIQPGDAIALDTGTTTMELAKQLSGIDNLTVVTNDIQIASYLERNTDVMIILAGGALRRHFHCTVGQMAIESISDLHVDKAFMAANGVHPTKGVTTPNMDMASIKAHMVDAADEVYLLADSSKLGKAAFITFTTLSNVDIMITDQEADPAFVDAVKQLGVDVRLAGIDNKQ